MWLVDAGDYDNDGKSELVFAIDRANEGAMSCSTTTSKNTLCSSSTITNIWSKLRS
jgi:hypothetical protein